MQQIRLTLALALAGIAVGSQLTCAADGPAAAPAPAAARAAPKLVVKGKDAPVVPVALWTENGKPMVLRGADSKNAPAGATIVHATIYNLGGPSFRKVVFPKGARFSPPSNTEDTLLFVLKGRLKVKMGDVAAEVGPNDAFRERAGVMTEFDAVEETELVETNIPAS